MQFLVRKTHHTTGEVFLDATRAKENEEFVVVDAENKEDAKEKVKKPKGLLEVVPSSFNNGLISKALSKTYRKAESGRLSLKPEKAPIPPRKDSE
ncbi:hypothetical protein [Staphylococcus sp. GDY8P31P]|uniref:DUF1381 domain-containing protein n=1 Tax=Staphylococcus sp. GDY8P31P TaxID=2804115 RepID=UPI001FD9F1E5|nr:hypothetical protein [Staphylococcus sp. GDY8P31P]